MARKVIAALEAKGISKKQISLRVGVHYNTVLRWFHGGNISSYNKAKLQAMLFNKSNLTKVKNGDLLKELTNRGYKVTLT